MSYLPPPRSIVAAFDRIESGLSDFIANVPLVSEHLSVWSPLLVTNIFDSCSQLDSLWKLRAGSANNLKITDHFQTYHLKLSSEWLVLWDGDGMELHPFAAWVGRSTYTSLPWWQAYNELKHDRWKNVKQATLANAVNAAAALFLAITIDTECHPVLAERKWFHTNYALDYAMSKLASPEGLLGVNVESSLFSYAIGSSLPNFPNMLAFYGHGTRRFGKWLEAKYGRTFWIG